MTNATNWKVGMSVSAFNSLERNVFEEYAKADINMMEISLSTEKYESIDYKATEKYAAETGVCLWSFHLPFWPFESNNIASKDADLRKRTVELQSKFIAKASDIGIKLFVIHPSGEPNSDGDRSELLSYAAESLIKLADFAESCGAVIAVEDLPRTCLGNCSNDILTLLNADSRLRVCFDTNHLLIEDNVSFVKAVGSKTVTLHVSDYDFRNERHWLPYEGKNDWKGIVSALEEANYSGPFMYEVGVKAPVSINRRELTCADFKENYLNCVNKREAKVIGTPNMEECLKNAYFAEPVIKSGKGERK